MEDATKQAEGDKGGKAAKKPSAGIDTTFADRTSPQLFYRHFDLDARSLDVENRTCDYSFSSEADVKRFYGTEVLDHSDGAIVKGRIQSVLLNHNPDRIIGPVTKERYENGRGLATCRFDDTEEGELAMTRVRSGSLRGISVGYQVHKYRKLAPNETYRCATRTITAPDDPNALPIYVATKWEPRENSLTPIPADTTVGIGREMSRSLAGIEIENQQGGETDMEQRIIDDKIAGARKEDADIRQRIFDKAAALGLEGLAFRLLQEGKTEADIDVEIAKKRQADLGKPKDAGAAEKPVIATVEADALVRALTEPEIILT